MGDYYEEDKYYLITVSYTHLDVYKRQVLFLVAVLSMRKKILKNMYHFLLPFSAKEISSY